MTTSTLPPQARRQLNWPVIAFMAIIHGGALLAPFFFSWSALGLAVALHWITGGLGITLGFHRLIAHRSFKTPKWLEYILATLGTLTAEGSPTDWVGMHRIHHKFSDTGNDPHDSNKGFWWSHMGWLMFEPPPQEQIRRYTGDLNGDPYYEFMQKFFLLPQFVLGALLYVWGGWSFVIWGVFVRLVMVYHTTWLVNSATHKFGYRNFDSEDASKNCWWVALMAYGEGWHNNHHAYPHSARHGLRWWEIDATWMAVKTLEFFGLATQIRTAKFEPDS
ncbi:MAG: fatty acid desaturase [Cyanobacteria bacterium P01_A01_bin.3]